MVKELLTFGDIQFSMTPPPSPPPLKILPKNFLFFGPGVRKCARVFFGKV